MSKGGSKPSKPEMSKSEKVQHAVAAAEWDHYKDTYVPLENQYLSDSQRNLEGRARANTSSAVMREGTDAMRLSALGGGVSRSAGILGSGLTAAKVGATHGAQSERDARMAGALGVGREIATDTTRSLSSLANTGARGAINDMQNKLMVSNARAQMVGAIAGAGIAAATGGMGGGAAGTGQYWSQQGGRTTTQVEPTSIF